MAWDAIYNKCYLTFKNGLTLPQQCADQLELEGIDNHYQFTFNSKSNAYNGTDIRRSVVLPVDKNEAMRDINVFLINLQPNFTAQVRAECDNKQIKVFKAVYLNISNVKMYNVMVSEFKCGEHIKVEYNQAASLIIIQNSGSSTVNYTFGKYREEMGK